MKELPTTAAQSKIHSEHDNINIQHYTDTPNKWKRTEEISPWKGHLLICQTLYNSHEATHTRHILYKNMCMIVSREFNRH